MELVSSLIIGGVILGVKIETREGSDFQSDPAAQIAHRSARFKSPVVSAGVRQIAFLEGAGWGVYPELALPFEIAVLPSHHQGKHLHVADPVGGVFLVNARCEPFSAEHYVSLNIQPDVRYKHLHGVLSAQN